MTEPTVTLPAAPAPVLFALIPAHNESRAIALVIQGASMHLPVLVVDDGSTDGTAVIAEAAGARVLRQAPNQGKGMALRAGFRAALAVGAQAVITLDADGQHDPAEIPGFIRQFEKMGTDLVIGERQFARMPLARRIGNTLGHGLFALVFGFVAPDNQSGYRLISRRLMEQTLSSREPGFEFEVEMIVICRRKGYSIAGIPIRTIYADQTSHIHPLRHVFKFLQLVLRLRLNPQG